MKENLDDREEELRGKLIKRLAVAGVMVGILLAALAFFDYLATPDEPETPVYTRPVPVSPKKELSQPVKPAELPEPPGKESVAEVKDDKSEAQKPEKTVKENDVPPKPEVAAAPALPASTVPVKAAPRPAVTGKPAVSAVSGRVVAAPAPAPAPAPASALGVSTKVLPSETSIRPLPAAPVKVSQPEATAAPVTKIPEEAVVPAKSAAVPSIPPRTVQPLVAPSPTLPRLLSGYVVQAGVFANAKAAEEMHAKLAMNGIPSTLEARVSVGPFKTREEAFAAQEKMKALGIDPVLIPPRRR